MFQILLATIQLQKGSGHMQEALGRFESIAVGKQTKKDPYALLSLGEQLTGD